MFRFISRPRKSYLIVYKMFGNTQKLLKSEKSLLLVGVLFVYGFHFLIRVLSHQNFGDSDANDALLTTSLRWAYQADAGPLYSWLLYAAMLVFGYSVTSFLLIKYTCVVFIYWVIFKFYLIFRANKKFALLAAFSVGSCYFMMWRLHEVMTYRLLTTLIFVTLSYAYFAMRGMRALVRVGVLGVLLGLGFLTEIYVLVALIAMVVLSFDRRVGWAAYEVLLAALLGLVIAFPFFEWLYDGGLLAQYIGWGGSLGSWNELRRAILYPFYILSPTILLLIPFLFRLGDGFRASWTRGITHTNSNENFLGKYLLTCYVAWVVLFGLFLPSAMAAPQSALPIFLPVLIVLFQRLEAAKINALWIAIALSLLPVTAAYFRVGNLLILDSFCTNCRWAIPYGKLATAIEECTTGAQRITIQSHSADTLANLKQFIPAANFVLLQGVVTPVVGNETANDITIEDAKSESGVEDERKRSLSERTTHLKIKWQQPYLSMHARERFSYWDVTLGAAINQACLRP